MIRSLSEWGDELAQRLATTSRSQALVRLLAALGAIGAMLLMAPWPIERTTASVMLGILVAGLTLWQTARPDSDAGTGLLAVVVLLAAFAGTADPHPGWPALLRMLGAALAMYVAHTGWALAAVAPAYASLEAPARRALGRRVLLALGAAILVGVLVVWPLFALPVGAWILAPAGIALVVLAVLVIPREPEG